MIEPKELTEYHISGKEAYRIFMKLLLERGEIKSTRHEGIEFEENRCPLKSGGEAIINLNRPYAVVRNPSEEMTRILERIRGVTKK